MSKKEHLINKCYDLVKVWIKERFISSGICVIKHQLCSLVWFKVDFFLSSRYTQILGMICQELGFDCVVLHSLIRQKERLAALAKFKSNQVRILIATDVASRSVWHPVLHFIFSVPGLKNCHLLNIVLFKLSSGFK